MLDVIQNAKSKCNTCGSVSVWCVPSASCILHSELHASEGSSSLASIVGDDHVGTSAPNAGERLEHHALLVEPAILRRRLQHRVLTAYLVCSRGLAESLFHLAENIEIRKRRLHQDEIGAFGDVDLHFA